MTSEIATGFPYGQTWSWRVLIYDIRLNWRGFFLEFIRQCQASRAFLKCIVFSGFTSRQLTKSRGRSPARPIFLSCRTSCNISSFSDSRVANLNLSYNKFTMSLNYYTVNPKEKKLVQTAEINLKVKWRLNFNRLTQIHIRNSFLALFVEVL